MQASRLLARLAVPATGLLLASTAFAEPGNHIRAGDAIIAPRISVGLEHRTNVYNSEVNPTPGTGLRVAPGLEISAEGPEIEFSLGGDYELKKYLQPELSNLDRFNDFGFSARLDAFTRSVIGLELRDDIGLRNTPADAAYAGRPYQTQFRNDLTGLVVARPGSAIDVKAGGAWAFDDFAVVSHPGVGLRDRSFNRRHTVGPRGQLEWRIFPHTAFVIDASYDMHRWDQNVIDGINVEGSGTIGAMLALPDSNQLRLLGGLRGRITERIVLVAQAGYGSANYQVESVLEEAAARGLGDGGGELDAAGVGFDARPSGLERLLVDTQLRYEPFSERTARLTLGYQKNFRDVYFTNYAAFHYVYGRGEARFNQRFGVLGELGVRPESYQGEVTRQDVLLRARGNLSYHLQDWASITTGLWWTQRASSDHRVEYDDFNFHVFTTFVY